MISDATELDGSPRLQPLPDFRAVKANPLGTLSLPRAVPLIPNLRERIKGKFDTAVAQSLVFCNGYAVEEVDGECFTVGLTIYVALSIDTMIFLGFANR